MKSHGGQIVVYLALILVAIAFLVLMNVGTFLGVSTRNKTMNAGDAAALAVANHQGVLLNRIGTDNIAHLKAALKGDKTECERIVMNQLRTCFLGPLEGLRIGSEFAKKNGMDADEEMRKLLLDHANDIINIYLTDQRSFPSPWVTREGGHEVSAWEEYAGELRLLLGEELFAFPDNADFLDAASGHYLVSQSFYFAIAGRSWCWFKFYAPGLLENYSSFRDWAPLEGMDEETRRRKSVNSEIYSLNLDMRVGRAVDLIGVELIMKLTGATEEDVRSAALLHDPTSRWFFYDRNEWRKWYELDPNGESAFPAMGLVRPEYDVKGCAAVCRVTKNFSTLVNETERKSVWSAAAKPFGTVSSVKDNEQDVVTGLALLVTDAFRDVRLVPIDSVGGSNLATANPDWMRHIREHLPKYVEQGPDKLNRCWYCAQLVNWERLSFRQAGSTWLKFHGTECVRPTGGLGGHGGSAHGH